MSRSTSASNNTKFVLATKLEGATNYNKWQFALQTKFFQCAKLTNLAAITRPVTLSKGFFKVHFKDDYKDASSDDDGAVDPFDNAPFVQQCFDYALGNGDGFADWVYNAFAGIHESLSDDIAEKITGVATGDVVALLAGINLAIGHTETHDSLDLEDLYTKTTMEKDGDNDIMKYTGVLKALTRRLKAAGVNMSDEKQQRVLLRGLHQDVFLFFIQDAERTPYKSYFDLEAAVLKAASKERMMQKLSALKPGTTHSAMTTRLGAKRSAAAGQEDDNGSHLAKIVAEAVMTSMAGVADKRDRDAGPCWQFQRTGKCDKGTSCRFSHKTKKRERNTSSGSDGDGVTKSNKRRGRIGDGEPAKKGGKMHCAWHNTDNHNTADCQLLSSPHFQEQLRKVQNGQGFAAVNTTNVRDMNHEFLCVTQVSLEKVFACQDTNSQLDRWCVDGGATTHATWDRASCTDIVSCNVRVDGPNSADSFTVKERGTRRFTALNPDGTTSVIVVGDVLISPAFPFHIFSEIKVLQAGATAIKKHNSWQFFKPAAQGGQPLFHASPRRAGAAVGAALYFIDQPGSDGADDDGVGTITRRGRAQPTTRPGTRASRRTSGGNFLGRPSRGSEGADDSDGDSGNLPELVDDSDSDSDSDDDENDEPSAPVKNVDAHAVNVARTSTAALAHPGPVCPLTTTTATARPATATTTTARKVSTARNQALLLELHLAHDHRNFASIAKTYGLTLPNPLPECWACMMAKPTRMTHDTVSTRQTSRPFEGFAADAKGPISVRTPEGYRYFFVVACLHSSVLWIFLTKTQADWKHIWPAFVKRLEAKSGKERCVAFIITDSHTVFTATDYKAFNLDRGIQTVNCSPHSQWQDPAERQIQTLMNAARASLIHAGGKPWMWGWAILHARDSINRLPSTRPVPGYEGLPRICIIDPSMTAQKALRTLHPFLCLAFKTVPMADRGADFDPRANPCVLLHYDTNRKAYALLTIPDLALTHSVEARFVPLCFPLRNTNKLSTQLDAFLHPTAEADLYSNIHGPGNVLRRHAAGQTPLAAHQAAIAQPAPILVQAPPGWSASRGYVPSAAALENAASINTASTPASIGAPVYTVDQLAQRTPRGTKQALTGQDSQYWERAILKDFDMIRKKKCFINITDVKPHGPNPPGVEQRFKIKYKGEAPIALEDLELAHWKARSVARGDRFKKGVHFDATASPVVHTAVLKVVIAYAVLKGLLLYQFDQEAAFYGNGMDFKGIVVRLPSGFHPTKNEIRPLHLPPLYGEMAAAVPGIPQGSLLQYRNIAPAFADLGFRAADADNCLFIHKDIDMLTTLHVDDGILAVPSHRHAEEFFGPKGLAATRKLTWSPLHHTLGVDFEVKYDGQMRRVFMSQRSFAATILERANMLSCNSTLTPAAPGRKYTKDDCPTTSEQKSALDAQGMTKELYHSITMSLNYLVMITRDDMRFIQGKLAKFCNNPGLEHFKAQKHALRFLKGTLDYGVEFTWRASDPPPTDGPLVIEAWTDSSYADDYDTARTTLGDVLKVNGATVSASSRLSARVDSCVNHSELNAFSNACTTPARGELTDGASMALARTSRSIVWLRGIKAALERRDVDKMPPTPVYVDNAGVISMLEGATIKSANKHIYKTLAENRERVNLDKAVIAVKIDTKDNLANAMTKQEHGLRDSAAQLRLIAGPRRA
jgi:hypothetical protein